MAAMGLHIEVLIHLCHHPFDLCCRRQFEHNTVGLYTPSRSVSATESEFIESNKKNSQHRPPSVICSLERQKGELTLASAEKNTVLKTKFHELSPSALFLLMTFTTVTESATKTTARMMSSHCQSENVMKLFEACWLQLPVHFKIIQPKQKSVT